MDNNSSGLIKFKTSATASLINVLMIQKVTMITTKIMTKMAYKAIKSMVMVMINKILTQTEKKRKMTIQKTRI